MVVIDFSKSFFSVSLEFLFSVAIISSSTSRRTSSPCMYKRFFALRSENWRKMARSWRFLIRAANRLYPAMSVVIFINQAPFAGGNDKSFLLCRADSLRERKDWQASWSMPRHTMTRRHYRRWIGHGQPVASHLASNANRPSIKAAFEERTHQRLAVGRDWRPIST